jgi:hypothetical protein
MGGLGAGGASAKGCTSTVHATGSAPLITDYENLDTGTLAAFTNGDGYDGGMYTYGDDTGSVSLQIGSPGHNSQRAAMLRHADYTSWGAGTGFWFSTCYDASVYAGVSFSAKGTGNPAWITLSNPEHILVADGGTCADPCGAEVPTAGFTPSADWQTYEFRWADLHPAVDPTRLHNFNLQVDRLNPSGTETAELWIDDVTFIPQ